MSLHRADVTLYTLSGRLHCGLARRRPRRHGVGFCEVCGDGDPAFRRRLLELTSGEHWLDLSQWRFSSSPNTSPAPLSLPPSMTTSIPGGHVVRDVAGLPAGDSP